uniref:PBP domain-containing protein n=1 Tax=Rhodopseudomonas palustris (strain BisA53) TaxID=316055 RepID=Q07N74_RHOP5
MSRQLKLKSLRCSVSVLALSVAAVIGSSAVQPAAAQKTGVNGIYGGGSSLVSLAMRQVMDCYKGTTLTGDGYSFDAAFTIAPPTPGKLPITTCTISSSVTGLYAAVGSGNGFRGFISNDPHQFNVAGTATPATPPPFIDSASLDTNFNTYPYPRIDFGASDSPLPNVVSPATLTTQAFTFTPATDWFVGTTSTTVTTAAAGNATYQSASWGEPLQLPLIEAPVAIALNVKGMTINSGATPSGSPTTLDAGGAIQLTTAQLCAIFAGAVRDWGTSGTSTPDSSTPIAWRDTAGNLSPTQQLFQDANVGNGVSTAAPYASGSLPITVVFRSDGSGTSYIVTNYLKSACTQLDTGTGAGGNRYAMIFNQSNLPSTSFSNLISNINAAFPLENRTANWIGANLSQGVAQAVDNEGNSTGSTKNGRIGYVSSDFTQPYQLATNVPFTPLSASIQNEDQRAANIVLPDPNSGSGNPPTFVPPTPAGADAAYSVLTGSDIPDATSTWAQWNLYNKTYANGTTYAGVDLSGKSKLGIPADVATSGSTAAAYPIVGSAYGAFYSCYNTSRDANRVNHLTGFLSWYYGADTTDMFGNVVLSTPAAILANNGFSALNSTLRANAAAVAATIAAGGSGSSCGSKTGAL